MTRTDAELNVWAAEFCGLEVNGDPLLDGSCCLCESIPEVKSSYTYIWNPCQDRDEAQRVVEKALSNGFRSKETEIFIEEARSLVGNGGGEEFEGFHDALLITPRQIVEAAYRANMTQKED